MLRMLLHTKKLALVAAVSISACAMTGCIESTFNLAHESRLPRGIAVPPGLTRADVFVTLDYIGPSLAKFTVRDKTGKKLATLRGKTAGDYFKLRTTPQQPDPRISGYQLVFMNSGIEILGHVPYREHENMVENGRIVALFYVIDDLNVVTEALGGRK